METDLLHIAEKNFQTSVANLRKGGVDFRGLEKKRVLIFLLLKRGLLKRGSFYVGVLVQQWRNIIILA